VADDPGYAFTGIDIREGWGDIVFVTIYGESIDGTPGPGGRALVQAVESAIDPQRGPVAPRDGAASLRSSAPAGATRRAADARRLG
jgi:hypothetical protein